jgi:magnesium-transporting ATPase (P-type)
MFYGNLKNCTYTQSTTNCNAAVGFFIALIVRSFKSSFLLAEWYLYLIGLVIFLIPGLISTYKQIKTGYSLERLELTKRPFRAF